MRLIILTALAAAQLSLPAVTGATEADQTLSSSTPGTPFPTKAEMHAAIDSLPDINALLKDLIKLTKETDLPKRMEKTTDKLAADLEKSGALEPDRNGLPDIKLTLKIFANALADEEVSEGLKDTLDDLEVILEKHMPEEGEP